MRTPSVKKYLVNHYENEETRHTATMLLGPPGIGKSIAVYEAGREIAEKLDRELVMYSDQEGRRIMNSDGNEEFFICNSIPLVSHEPIDLTGVPRENDDGLVEFKPLLWIKVMADNPGILFLDDFLDVQRPDLFSAAYKITLERRAGYYRLDDGVMIVCASNTPEESSLSQMIPAPLTNRMIELRIDEPTLREWASWMDSTYGDNWDKRTLAFLERFESGKFFLNTPEETEVLNNFPTPRTWTRASLELKRHDNPEVLDGLLGPEVGQKFYAFTQVDVNVSELIRNPALWDKQTLDGKYMLCLELASWFRRTDEPEKGFELLDKMKDESRQFPILVFLSTPWRKLSELLDILFRERPEYSELVTQTISDRKRIST